MSRTVNHARVWWLILPVGAQLARRARESRKPASQMLSPRRTVDDVAPAWAWRAGAAWWCLGPRSWSPAHIRPREHVTGTAQAGSCSAPFFLDRRQSLVSGRPGLGSAKPIACDAIAGSALTRMPCQWHTAVADASTDWITETSVSR